MATRYLVGTSPVTWNGTNTAIWSTTSGGPGGASVPASGDDAFIDANSPASITVAAGEVRNVGGLDFTGYTGTFTLSGSGTNLSVWRDFKLSAGMTFTHGNSAYLQFRGSNTSTVTTAGKLIGLTQFGNSTGTPDTGTWVLQDAWTSVPSGNINLIRATLDLNGQTVDTDSFISSSSNTRALITGAAQITVRATTNAWNFAIAGGSTVNAAGSTITLTAPNAMFLHGSTSGGGGTYGEVKFTGSGQVRPTVAATTYIGKLTKVVTANTTGDSLLLGSAPTAGTIGTLEVRGFSPTARLLVNSNTLGTRKQLTVGTLIAEYVDFEDVGISGTAAGTGGTSLGDGGNNSGITFDAPKIVDWIGPNTGGNWNDATKWQGGSVPLIHDTARFAYQNTGTGDYRVHMNLPRLPSIDASGLTKTAGAAFQPFVNSTTQSYYGDMHFGGSGVGTNGTNAHMPNGFNLTFAARRDAVLHPGPVAWGGAATTSIGVAGGSLTLLADWTTNVSRSFILTGGTFDANGFNVTASVFSASGTTPKTLKMGSGRWTSIAAGGQTVWTGFSAANAVTLDAGTSTIVVGDKLAGNKHFVGSGMTYYDLEIVSPNASTVIIQQSNTFREIRTTGGAAEIQFVNGTTQTFTGRGLVMPDTGAPTGLATEDFTTNVASTYSGLGGTTASWRMSENLIANGNFEDPAITTAGADGLGAGYWDSVVTRTTVAGEYRTGSAAVKVVAPAVADAHTQHGYTSRRSTVAQAAGTTVVCSAWFKGPAGKVFRVSGRADAVDVGAGGSAGESFGSATFTATGGWQRVSTAPWTVAGGTFRPKLQIVNNVATTAEAAGWSFFLDSVQIEVGSTVNNLESVRVSGSATTTGSVGVYRSAGTPASPGQTVYVEALVTARNVGTNGMLVQLDFRTPAGAYHSTQSGLVYLYNGQSAVIWAKGVVPEGAASFLPSFYSRTGGKTVGEFIDFDIDNVTTYFDNYARLSSFVQGAQATLAKGGGASPVALKHVLLRDLNVQGDGWYAGTGAQDLGNNSGWFWGWDYSYTHMEPPMDGLVEHVADGLVEHTADAVISDYASTMLVTDAVASGIPPDHAGSGLGIDHVASGIPLDEYGQPL